MTEDILSILTERVNESKIVIIYRPPTLTHTRTHIQTVICCCEDCVLPAYVVFFMR